MGELNSEVFQAKVEIKKVKASIGKYRLLLIKGFYLGGALLLLAFWWIIFPPELTLWRLISNICFMALLFNLWVSYWIINKIKSNQASIGKLRTKIKQIVWEKSCDCQGPCDCVAKIEREMAEESNSWNDGILAEVEHGTELP